MNDNISSTVRRALAALDYDPDRDEILDFDVDFRSLLDADHDGADASPEMA